MLSNEHPKAYLAGDPTIPKNFGWIDAPHEVDKIVSRLPRPLATGSVLPESDEKTEVLTYQYFRSVVGRNEYPGPQLIGDCVGHGWKRGVDYTAVMQIHMKLKEVFGPTMDYKNPDVDQMRQQLLQEFEEASSEVIYALSRVEVGHQQGSYSDGSVGAWAGDAVTRYGTLSWKALKEKGYGNGVYDSKRAKDWGAKGLPNDLEPLAHQHTVKNISKVTNFKDAASLGQNGYVIPVCSNQGFTMVRDSMGFAKAQGIWNHCMMLSSCRWDRPGMLCHQNWGLDNPSGPLYKDQPGNTFWVDANIIDRMLSQGDSFSPSAFEGYPVQNLLTWAH